MGLESQNLDLPREPGVYLFKNKLKKVLYVGKATDINRRVKSYFSPNPDRLMIPKLVESSVGIVTGFIFIINIFYLGGNQKLKDKSYFTESLIDFPGH